MENKYYLLEDEDPKNVSKCTKEIDRLILKFVKEFKKELKIISKKYPKVGIGDTQTDELIVKYTSDILYDKIHW